MAYPLVTAVYAGVLGLIFTVLSSWVIGGRLRTQTLHDDGGTGTINRRIRAHANFAEYVPLILLVVALLESHGAGRSTVHGLLLPLTIARVLHPFGMFAPLNSMQQFICRGAPAVITLAVLAIASILLLVRVA
jgi:uncharacterized protein